MSETHIPAPLRRVVVERARGLCEYCGVHGDDVLFPHEVDHIIAEQHGGATEPENLTLACFHCNRRKGPNIASIDPSTDAVVTLFHPRRERWWEHFAHDHARIIPLTATGRATAGLLGFNRADRLQAREALARVDRYPLASENR